MYLHFTQTAIITTYIISNKKPYNFIITNLKSIDQNLEEMYEEKKK